MNYPPEAISLPRAISLVGALNRAVNEKEDNRSTAFKRAVLGVLREFGVDCRTTVRSADGTFSSVRVISVLLPEVHWNVTLVLSDWLDRYLDTGYDYVAAWSEAQSFQGC